MSPLNVAVVGIGEVAQNTHLPTLLLTSHLFRPVALVDVSPGALAHANAKFHVARTYLCVEEMLAREEDVDVVMVMSANEFHVQHTLLALRAGKHVFVEKPMALTLAGAEEIERERVRSGKVVMVGTMRRYATAFLRVKEIIEREEGIAYVRVRDLIGRNDYFVSQSGAYPLKFNDIPPAQTTFLQSENATQMAAALGPNPSKRDCDTYTLLAGLGVHDISAMRELIGMPRGVKCATRSPDGLFMSVVFDYGPFVAYYEVGIDNVQTFDAHVEVYTRDKRLKVTYDTPYVKGLPITATILSTRPNGDHSEEVLRPTYEDAFTLEYKVLYDAVANGGKVKTGPVDAMQDLVIFKMIMDALV